MPEQMIEQQLDKLNISEITKYWNDIVTKYGGYLPESQKGSLTDFISGKKELSLKEWMAGVGKFLFFELLQNGKLLGTLIVLTILSLFLQSLQNAFEQQTVSKVAYAIVFMVLMIVALNSFRLCVSYALEAIQTMSHFVLALLPLLLALIASSGGLVTAGFFHPMLLVVMNTTGFVVEHITLPFLFCATLLSIVSTLSKQYKATKFAGVLTMIAVGSLGVLLTVFLGVISVKGMTSAVADGIVMRTAKFVTGNFIPVVGRMFTDAADTVVTASLLLKNAVGVIGVVIVLVIAMFPALKILVIAFIYRLSSAILQPLGGEQMTQCLDIMSKSVMYVFAALAVVSLMFFLTITVVIAAGNLTVLMR